MTPYTTGVPGQYAKIYFSMSLWNPYQAVQMAADVPADLLGRVDPLAYALDASCAQ